MYDRLVRLACAAQIAALCTILSGCFYNSEWGGAKRAQKRNAAHAAPATLAAAPQEDTAPRSTAEARTMRVRVYATPHYVAQTLDWQRQARELVEDTNRTLIPMLGVRLEIERAALWTPTASEENLEATLEALRAYDNGDDADWVFGLIGGLPRVTQSFHQLGMGHIIGKHLVVRAAGRIEEHDAIEKSFNELDEAERVRLERDRKRHRAVAVLLHEIGHTLGAMHEQEPHSIMHPEYSPNMEGISSEGVALMRISLQHRGEKDPRELARDLLGYLDQTPSGPWVAKDREAMVNRLTASAGTRKAVSPPTAIDKPADTPRAADDVPDLRPPDRERYRKAFDAWKHGDVHGASEIAQPLYAAYPNTFAVQDMRCQLAMARGEAWSKTSAECEAITRLTRGH